MKFLMAAGGTGGHVIPALVVARELIARDPATAILFVGTAKGIENRLVPEAGFDLELVRVRAWQGQTAVHRLKNLAGAPYALFKAFQILRRFQPDAVLGVGGYASGPIMLAAGISGTPIAVLEPNAYPGMANRWIAPYVSRALLAFGETASFFRAETAIVTGIPVRKEFFAIPRHSRGPLRYILVFGGSQGARTLNRAAVEALPLLAAQGDEIQIVHQTGQNEYNSVREAYSQSRVPAEVLPYIDNMPAAFSEADLIVCRAGANTVAELAAAGRAAILVPFPAAANQHQLRNAEALARIGAARLILDKDLSGPTLAAVISEFRSRPELLEGMADRVRTFAHPDAAREIADELIRLAG